MPEAPQLPDLTGKHVLIVDDDPEVLTPLLEYFKLTGAAVKTAADGQAAVDAFDSEVPDLMILDMMLPKRSGFLVMEKIRAKRQAAGKPKIVMITGNQGTRHKDYAETLGVDDYLNKPFTLDRLTRSVGRLFTTP